MNHQGAIVVEKDDRTAPPRVYRGPVRRLRVVVEDGSWRVEAATSVDRMTIPASWEPDRRSRRGASWVEVLDARGEVIHRQRIRDPLDTSVELVSGGNFERGITSRPLVLDVTVPDVEAIAKVRVVARGEELAPQGKGGDELRATVGD
jgi:hypothetical protein